MAASGKEIIERNWNGHPTIQREKALRVTPSWSDTRRRGGFIRETKVIAPQLDDDRGVLNLPQLGNGRVSNGEKKIDRFPGHSQREEKSPRL